MAGVPPANDGNRPIAAGGAQTNGVGPNPPAILGGAVGGWRQERALARGRPDKSLARFERIALVLSGGEALGAYQAGAYAALEKSGVRPNWVAGSGIGAVNAAIIAGNLPHERALHLRRFWQQISQRAALRRSWGLGRWARRAADRNLPPCPPRREMRPRRGRAGRLGRRIARTDRRGGRFRAGQFGRRARRARRGQSGERRRDLFRQRPACAQPRPRAWRGPRCRVCRRSRSAASCSPAVRFRCRRSTTPARPTPCALRSTAMIRCRAVRGGDQPLGARNRRDAPHPRFAPHDRVARRARAAGAARRGRHPPLPRRGERCDDDDPAPRPRRQRRRSRGEDGGFLAPAR